VVEEALRDADRGRDVVDRQRVVCVPAEELAAEADELLASLVAVGSRAQR
jgi:hypothetical protein